MENPANYENLISLETASSLLYETQHLSVCLTVGI